MSLHNGNTRKEVLKLYNEFVGVNRGILIHEGESPKISEGCLLIGKKEVAPYMLETEMETMVKQVVLRLNEQTNQSTQTDKRLENFLKNNVEVRIQNNFKIPQPPKIESQNEIPPNVIRIETQDGSGEFIEIELPPTALLGIDDPPLQDTSAMFIPALRGVGSAIKGIKNITGMGRSLTLNEVLEITDRLKKVFNKNGEDTRIRLIEDQKELDKIWREFTQNERRVKPDVDDKGKPMKYTILDDNTTRIQYRTHSSNKSNNLPTIDIHNKELKVQRKIHIDIHKNKGGI